MIRHRVISRVQEILPEDLPKVRDEDGTERTANEQELQNMGVIATAALNIYDRRVQYNDFDSPGTLRPTVEIKGTVLTEGGTSERFRRLPAGIREQVLQAEVYRSVLPEEPERTRPSLRDRLDQEMTRDGIAPEDQERVRLESARQQADDPNAPVERVRIMVADIDRAGDVVEAEDLPPNCWSGESER